MSRTIGNTLGASMGSREACVEVVHTYPITFTASNDTYYTVDFINASADRPVDLELSYQVVTAFNSSVSDFLYLTVEGAALIEGLDAAVAGYFPASNDVVKARITADSMVRIKVQSDGDAPTTGHAVFIVKEIVQNIVPVVQP
jgi:hypothetical protein